MLVSILPMLHVYDAMHLRLPYSITRSYRRLCQPLRSQFSDLNGDLPGDTCAGVVLAFGASSFCHHVYAVISGCSKKQVSRVDTRSVVASMTDKHSIGDRAVSQLKCDSVSKRCAVFSSDISISTRKQGSHPTPAITRCINFRPEPICEWLVWVWSAVLTGTRTKLTSGFDERRPRQKSEAALLTDVRGLGRLGVHRYLLSDVASRAVTSSAETFRYLIITQGRIG